MPWRIKFWDFKLTKLFEISECFSKSVKTSSYRQNDHRLTSDISPLGILQGLHKALLFVLQIVPVWMHAPQDSIHDRKRSQMLLGSLVKKPSKEQEGLQNTYMSLRNIKMTALKFQKHNIMRNFQTFSELQRCRSWFLWCRITKIESLHTDVD